MPNRSLVTIMAMAETGTIFSGFGGAECSGLNPCVLSMNRPQTIDGRFAPDLATLIYPPRGRAELA